MQHDITTHRQMLRVFKHQYRGSQRLTKVRYLAMSYMVHHIWATRNRCLFNHELIDIDRLFIKIQIHTFSSLNTYTFDTIINDLMFKIFGFYAQERCKFSTYIHTILFTYQKINGTLIKIVFCMAKRTWRKTR